MFGHSFVDASDEGGSDRVKSKGGWYLLELLIVADMGGRR